MSIRFKLLLLLLAIALVPLAIVSAFDRAGTRRLGGELARSARQSLSDRTAEQLQNLIRDQARQLRDRLRGMEHVLRGQARAVEARLAAPPPAGAQPRFAAAYDRRENLPPDMAPSARHFRFDAGGSSTPIDISYSDQVYKLAPGVAPENVGEMLARLASMPAEYEFLRSAHPELVFWQFTSLECGIHTSFPGHGGYPVEYDPRKRPWYRAARDSGQLSWSDPYFDASSEQRILTASMPVRGPDGAIAGVTGLDVTVADIVESMKLPENWIRDSRSMLVRLRSGEDGRPDRVAILAQPGLHRKDQRWNANIDAEWLESESAAEFGEVMNDLRYRRFATRQLAYQSRDSLWVYGPVDEQGTFLVIILPFDEVVRQAAEAEQRILSDTNAQLRGTGLIVLLVILVVVLVALVGSRSVTQPIRALAASAERIAAGDFEARVRIDTSDELGTLGRQFNAMVPQLEDRMKLRHSLSLAMEVQQHLLPSSAPKVAGLDVAGKSIYCDETGGDYYDFIELADLGPNRLGLAIGDVTGHGIAAALLMTTARALLRSHVNRSGGLDSVMNGLNRYLAKDMSAGRFMTLFYLMIDTSTQQAWWASAGHDPAIVFDPENGAFSDLPGGDIPLGIEADWQFREHGPAALATGQVIVIGTDGIWESRNSSSEFFGKDKLREVIRRNAARSAADISHAITDALVAFRADFPQEDDVTMVVIKVLGPAGR